ncbi:MAG: hypothetical protein WCL16_07305, partial [bacterium]
THGGASGFKNHVGRRFDFKPQFKLWLALNHCPKVSADDGAIWRRILRIGFEHTVTPERRDKTLKPYLRDPKGGAPAVLAWAVEGCLRWQRDGLRVPAAVARSTSAYRHESDPLATFFEDCLLFTSAAWTSWANLWAAYAAYAEEYGTPGKYRVAPKRLQERLKAHDCRGEHRYAGRGWAGVELRNDWKTPIKPIDHATHATYATTSVNFSTKSELAKVSQVTAWAAQVAWSPIPEAVELDFNAVEADPYESAERDAIREYDGAIEVAK